MEPHSFSMQIRIPEQINTEIDSQLAGLRRTTGWDGTLALTSKKTTTEQTIVIEAGGTNFVGDANTQVARDVTNKLRQSKAVHYLSIDANRAYDPRVGLAEKSTALGTDWESETYRRNHSHLQITTLYDEWRRYLMGIEGQTSIRHTQAIRSARKNRLEEPSFTDPFGSYRIAIQHVLPHLSFSSVEFEKGRILFDSAGEELEFNDLSNGERDIAFLVSQIERFGLRDGLLLVDEPELHLNPDLTRTWIRYLSNIVKTGQIWLATHSLEAVESAGAESTFILERDVETRKVQSVARLDTRPLIASLSRELGTPAFSISNVCFVFVEGEPSIGERERFVGLSGNIDHLRFIDSSAGTEVVNRVRALRSIQSEAEVAIRIGGIVDRDFKQEAEIAQIKRDHEVFVLPVHEIENYFLHPRTLEFLMNQHGVLGLTALDLIRESSDQRAGSWIFQYAMATPNAKQLVAVSSAAKDTAKKFPWQQFEQDRASVIDRIKERWTSEAGERGRIAALLEIAANAYERQRKQDDLWKYCEGKEVLNTLAPRIGFSAGKIMIEATFVAWENGQTPIPQELQDMRDYLAQL